MDSPLRDRITHFYILFAKRLRVLFLRGIVSLWSHARSARFMEVSRYSDASGGCTTGFEKLWGKFSQLVPAVTQSLKRGKNMLGAVREKQRIAAPRQPAPRKMGT